MPQINSKARMREARRLLVMTQWRDFLETASRLLDLVIKLTPLYMVVGGGLIFSYLNALGLNSVFPLVISDSANLFAIFLSGLVLIGVLVFEFIAPLGIAYVVETSVSKKTDPYKKPKSKLWLVLLHGMPWVLLWILFLIAVYVHWVVYLSVFVILGSAIAQWARLRNIGAAIQYLVAYSLAIVPWAFLVQLISESSLNGPVEGKGYTAISVLLFFAFGVFYGAALTPGSYRRIKIADQYPFLTSSVWIAVIFFFMVFWPSSPPMMHGLMRELGYRQGSGVSYLRNYVAIAQKPLNQWVRWVPVCSQRMVLTDRR